MKSAISKANDTLFLLTVGLLSWLIPGGGHLMLKENRRAFIIFVTIIFTFCIGIYIGSIGIINPVGAKPWYIAQIMNSPMVAVLGYFATKGDYPVFGRPNEIGQIYTSIAGLLNLLCVVNAVYLAHLSKIRNAGD